MKADNYQEMVELLNEASQSVDATNYLYVIRGRGSKFQDEVTIGFYSDLINFNTLWDYNLTPNALVVCAKISSPDARKVVRQTEKNLDSKKNKGDSKGAIEVDTEEAYRALLDVIAKYRSESEYAFVLWQSNDVFAEDINL